MRSLRSLKKLNAHKPTNAIEIPKAVAYKAVPIPALTPAGSDIPDFESARNVSTIPKMVPSKPINGAAVTMVSKIHRRALNSSFA